MTQFEFIRDVQLVMLLKFEPDQEADLPPARLAKLVLKADVAARKFCRERGIPVPE